MPEVSYDTLSRVVSDIRDGKTAPVYLLYGDEYLCKSACKAVLDALVPSPKAQRSNCEKLDGASASMSEIIAHMQTFSLFPGRKVVVVFGAKEHMIVMEDENDATVLCEAIEHGLPVENSLILVLELVDKRKRLYKAIKKTGVVIDCSLSKGARAAEVRRQKDILGGLLAERLGQAGKTAAPGTFDALFERTGADLRTFDGEVEKLISFVGQRKTVTVDDVETALEKSRQDPVYELGNAVGERVVGKVLSHVGGLLQANLYPLQILSAVAGRIRKLILSKDAMNALPQGKWKPGMTFPVFQRVVLPELAKRRSDLTAGKTHPFVLYKTFVHAENYSLEELIRALEYCLEADQCLKTTGRPPRLVLEDLVIKVCSSR